MSLTYPPRGLIPRGPELAMVAVTVAERGQMMLGFILPRPTVVWARVRVAGGLEDTTSFCSPFTPTTRLPDPVEDMLNAKTPNKLRKAQNCRTTPLKGPWSPVLLEDDDGALNRSLVVLVQ